MAADTQGRSKEWIDGFDGKTDANLARSARASLANGQRLLEDAKLLQSWGRLPSCLALAVLAEEELSKCLILLMCRQNNRWDSVVHRGLTHHDKKQSFSTAFVAVAEQMVARLKFNSHVFAAPPLTERDLERMVKTEFNGTKPIRDGRAIDRLKQSALYVNVGRKGEPTSIPEGSITEESVQEVFRSAARTQDLAVTLCKEYEI